MAAVREQLSAYARQLDKDDRGMELLFLGETVQLCSRRCYEDRIAAVLASRKNAPLSGAAMEVLAIIAYNQPVTKGFVEQVRGVESGQIVNNLVEKPWWRRRDAWTFPAGPSPTGPLPTSSAASASRSFRSCRPFPAAGPRSRRSSS